MRLGTSRMPRGESLVIAAIGQRFSLTMVSAIYLEGELP